MDAFNYLKEVARLCNCYDCPECPLCKINFGKGCNIDANATDDDIIKLISSVENWAKEHPRKRIIQDFLEKYPNVKLNEDGVPERVCPDDLGYCEDNSFCYGHTCNECWNRPLEE